MEQIKLEDLVKELEQGSNYMKKDSEIFSYYHYDNVKFIFEKDYAEILKEYGFDGEEDFTSIGSDIKWSCKVPKEIIDKSLLELISTGKTIIKNVEIEEYAEGRLPYQDKKNATRYYRTDLTILLKKDQKQIVDIENPKERKSYELEEIYNYR